MGVTSIPFNGKQHHQHNIQNKQTWIASNFTSCHELSVPESALGVLQESPTYTVVLSNSAQWGGLSDLLPSVVGCMVQKNWSLIFREEFFFLSGCQFMYIFKWTYLQPGNYHFVIVVKWKRALQTNDGTMYVPVLLNINNVHFIS